MFTSRLSTPPSGLLALLGALLCVPVVSGQGRVVVGAGTTLHAYEVGVAVGGALEAAGALHIRGATIRFTSPDATGGLLLGSGIRVELTAPQQFTGTTITGPVRLGGVLRLEVPTGTSIPTGTRYTVLTCTGGCMGTFERVEAPLSVDVTYGLNAVSVRILQASAVDDAQGSLQGVLLHAAAPNPFSDVTTMRLELAAPAHVRAEVFDVLGRSLGVLSDGPMTAGMHTVTWEARDVSPGAYLVKVFVDGTGLLRPVLKR